MSDSNSSNRLAKNTIFLYIRMMITMLVSLYTSRVILKYLGVEDYGIYNAVGGVVSLFSIISGSLTTSISRNLTYELGTGNKDRLRKVFYMSVNIQLILIAIVVLLSETIAVWFLNKKMVIPPDRLYAANWVLQFAILSFSINLLTVPYNASIVSHERMSIFAYIGVADAVAKLLIVYLINISPIDKLISYSALLFLVALIQLCVYWVYCRRNFEECKYAFRFDSAVFKEMFGFATWSFIGASSSVLRDQGVNIVLNLFFGPIVNAARAISMQVNGAINGFVSNFMMALTPQITKAYAQGDFKYLLNCIYRGSKFSFFLLFALSLPVLVETEFILHLWLENVPDTTVWFVRYILLFSLVDTYSRTMINANNATGDIKTYQLVIGSLNLTVLPIVYIILKHGAAAESTVLVSIVVSLIGLYPRIYFNKKHFPIGYWVFTYRVLIPTCLVSAVSAIPPLICFSLMETGLIRLALIILVSIVSVIISVFLLGCTNEERRYAISYIKTKLRQ